MWVFVDRFGRTPLAARVAALALESVSRALELVGSADDPDRGLLRAQLVRLDALRCLVRGVVKRAPRRAAARRQRALLRILDRPARQRMRALLLAEEAAWRAFAASLADGPCADTALLRDGLLRTLVKARRAAWRLASADVLDGAFPEGEFARAARWADRLAAQLALVEPGLSNETSSWRLDVEQFAGTCRAAVALGAVCAGGAYESLGARARRRLRRRRRRALRATVAACRAGSDVLTGAAMDPAGLLADAAWAAVLAGLVEPRAVP
ncbi:MAG: hypothetical protein R3E86_15120 [Pseudomonadales bacterium]